MLPLTLHSIYNGWKIINIDENPNIYFLTLLHEDKVIKVNVNKNNAYHELIESLISYD